MNVIELWIRPEGNAGYVVCYRLPGEPPVELARFEDTAVGRREATMFKNGLRAGLVMAARFLEKAAPFIDEEHKHAMLESIADHIQLDVLEQHPEGSTEYDLWVEPLLLGMKRWPYSKRVLVGVIDMGELYQGVYVWEDDAWQHEATLSPAEMIDRIKEARA